MPRRVELRMPTLARSFVIEPRPTPKAAHRRTGRHAAVHAKRDAAICHALCFIEALPRCLMRQEPYAARGRDAICRRRLRLRLYILPRYVFDAACAYATIIILRHAVIYASAKDYAADTRVYDAAMPRAVSLTLCATIFTIFDYHRSLCPFRRRFTTRGFDDTIELTIFYFMMLMRHAHLSLVLF